MNRLRIYIAGPISKGDLAHNVNQATDAFVALAKAGLAPMCPHWSVYCKPAVIKPEYAIPYPKQVWCKATADGNDRMSHEEWLGIDFAWVEVAHAVLRLPGESRGADAEVWFAANRLIPVFGDMKSLLEWAEAQ